MANKKVIKKKKIRWDAISILISVITLLLSVWQQYYIIKKDTQNEIENISIALSSIQYKDIATYTKVDSNNSLIDVVQYDVIISNTSKQRISIVDYNFSLYKDDTFIQYNNILSNTVHADGQNVLIPFSLESGESKKLTFNINTLLTRKPFEYPYVFEVDQIFYIDYYIEDLYDKPIDELGSVNLGYIELKEYLMTNGFDIFNNIVSVENHGNSNLLTTEEPKFPIYKLELITSKDNIFYKIITHSEIS